MRTIGTVLLTVAALCAPAAAADLGELVERSRAAEGTPERAAVLDELAALASSDAASAEGATRALAEALADEAQAVRAHAAELLAAAPARGLALQALCGAARAQAAAEAELQAVVRGAMEDLPDLNERSSAARRSSEKAKEEQLEKLRELQERTAAMKAALEANVDLPKVRAALVAALPRFADERAADALGALSADVPFGEECEAVVAALVTLGGARALEHVGAVFERYEDTLKERKKAWRELERAKPREKPSEIWADEVWERKERERIAAQQEAFETQAAAIDATIERVAARVRADAEARGLPAAPERVDRGRDWRNWARKAGKESAPLPGVDG